MFRRRADHWADEFVLVFVVVLGISGTKEKWLSLARCHGRPVRVAGESRCVRVRVRVHAGAR